MSVVSSVALVKFECHLVAFCYLEGVLVSVWESAWAVAVAVDLEVGHLGDGNPREGGVHVNAKQALELGL